MSLEPLSSMKSIKTESINDAEIESQKGKFKEYTELNIPQKEVDEPEEPPTNIWGTDNKDRI